MTRPSFRNDFSWNAIPGVVSVLAVIGGGFYGYGALNSTTGELSRTMNDRAANSAALHERMDSRITTLEGQVRQIDRLEYRITTVEQNSILTSQVLDGLSKSLSEQSADIKVIREILSRLDKGPGSAR